MRAMSSSVASSWTFSSIMARISSSVMKLVVVVALDERDGDILNLGSGEPAVQDAHEGDVVAVCDTLGPPSSKPLDQSATSALPVWGTLGDRPHFENVGNGPLKPTLKPRLVKMSQARP